MQLIAICCNRRGVWTAHFTHHIFSSFVRTHFNVTSTLAQVWRAQRTLHVIACVIFMRSCCVFDSLRFSFPLLAVYLLSSRPVHPPGSQLLPSTMWRTNTLCTLANEDLGTLAEYHSHRLWAQGGHWSPPPLEEVDIDFRVSGLPHAVVKEDENFRVRELVKKIESHPHRPALQADLNDSLRPSTLCFPPSLSSSLFILLFFIFILHVGWFEEKSHAHFHEWGVRHFDRQHPLSQVMSPKSSTTTTFRRPLIRSSRSPSSDSRSSKLHDWGNQWLHHRHGALFTTVHSGERRCSEP